MEKITLEVDPMDLAVYLAVGNSAPAVRMSISAAMRYTRFEEQVNGALDSANVTVLDVLREVEPKEDGEVMIQPLPVLSPGMEETDVN